MIISSNHSSLILEQLSSLSTRCQMLTVLEIDLWTQSYHIMPVVAGGCI